MSLQPPPVSRHRASSINVRPSLSLQTIGRRRSTSCLDDQQPHSHDQPHPVHAPQSTTSTSVHQPQQPQGIQSDTNPKPNMLFVFASRFLHWLHLSSNHSSSFTVISPASPRSSTEEYVLPLSASTQDSFSIPVPQKHSSSSLQWFQDFPSMSPSMLLVIISLPLSTAVVFYGLSTLPISLSWPRTLSDLAQVGRELHAYSQSGTWPLLHVLSVMAISAIWKHAWSIPGSVLWNVLAGALFSPAFATVMLTALTTIGSACATLLSTPLTPFLVYMFPRALDMTRSALGGDSEDEDTESTKSSAWVRLSILRLIGVVPWSGINIACGVSGVSMVDCMLGTFIGCLPWTAVTCQIGDILQTVAKTPSPSSQTISSLITTPEIIFKLVFLSFLSLAPILGRDYLRSLIAPVAVRPMAHETRQARWKWVHEWRHKIRITSRSRIQERAQMETELNILVQEKRRLEDLPS